MQLVNLSDLGQLNIPSAVIKGWIQEFNSSAETPHLDYRLTSFQNAVLTEPATFDTARNLLVAGPTSSGKTLIAQAIAARLMADHPESKVLYLVPLRTLVTEKWLQFKSVFFDKIVLPISHDYPQSDLVIAEKRWNISICVFDKVYNWLASPSRVADILQNVGLVIVDELQVIEQQERGEKLEIILSLLRWQQTRHAHNQLNRPRIVALGTSMAMAKSIQDWLEADIVPNRPIVRPITLYQGYIHPSTGSVIYADNVFGRFVSQTMYPRQLKEVFDASKGAKKHRNRLVYRLVAAFLKQKWKVMVYVARQRDAVELALQIANSIPIPEDYQASINHNNLQFGTLDESDILDGLKRVLPYGVGFHHGDMTLAEMTLVEERFRSRRSGYSINVIVVTPTLGMGINLPADVVLMRDLHTFGSNGEEDFEEDLDESPLEPGRRWLTAVEYSNFAGRAGRYNSNAGNDDFGLCLAILTTTTTQSDIDKVEDLIRQDSSALESHLFRPHIGYHLHTLTLLSAVSEIVWEPEKRSETVIEIFRRSLAWHTKPELHTALISRIELSLGDLRNAGFISRFQRPTGIGHAMAKYSLSLTTVQQLKNIANNLSNYWPEHRIEILAMLAEMFELDSYYPRRIRSHLEPIQNAFEDSLHGYFTRNISDQFYPVKGLFDTFVKSSNRLETNLSGSKVRAIMRAYLVSEWINGRSAKSINEDGIFKKLSLKALESLSGKIAQLIGALRDIWEQTLPTREVDWERWERIDRELWIFEQNLIFGLPIDAVLLPILMQLTTRKTMSRRTYVEIAAKRGTVSFNSLLQYPPEDLLSTTNWLSVRNSISWWQNTPTQNPHLKTKLNRLVRGAIDSLYEQEYNLDFSRTKALFPHQDKSDKVNHLSEEASRIILGRTRVQIDGFSVDEFSGLSSAVTSILMRAPLSIKVRNLTGAPNIMRVAEIDNHDVVLCLVPGKPNNSALAPLAEFFREVIIISSQKPDLQKMSNYFKERVRLWITIEALIAGCELAQYEPKYSADIKRILSTGHAELTTPSVVFRLVMNNPECGA